jgi:hypothetical protein
MRSAAEANGVPFQNLFGRLEGYKFALATTGPEAKAYADELTKMHDATGTAAGQAAERMQTFDRQAAILGNSLQSLMIGIGTAFLPALTSIVSSVSAAVQSFSDWSDANPGLAGQILAVVGAIAALVASVAFADKIVNVIRASLLLLTSPLGLIIAAVAVFAIAWENNWGGVRDVVSSVVGAIGPIIGTLGDLVSTVGFAIANGLNEGSVAGEAFREGPFGQLGSFVSDTVATIAGVMRSGFAALGPFVNQIGEAIGGLAAPFAELALNVTRFVNLFERSREVTAVFNLITQTVPAAVEHIAALIRQFERSATVANAFKGAADAVRGAVALLGDVIGNVAGAIGGFVTNADNQRAALNGVQGAAQTAGAILSTLAGIIGTVVTAIVSFVSNTNNQRAALTGIQSAAQAVSTVLSVLASMVMQAVGAIVAFVTNANNQAAALRIVGAAGDAVRAVLGALATAVAVVVGWFSNFASHLMGTGNQAKTMGERPLERRARS